MELKINNLKNNVKGRTTSARKPTLLLFALTILITSKAISAENSGTDSRQQYNLEPIQPLPLNIKFNEAKASLGETLFTDTRLSVNNAISCANCHQLESGGDDNKALGISLSSEQHIVNTPSIYNAQFNFKQNWDGSANTLEEQIDKAITNHHKFNNTWEIVLSRLSADVSLKKAFNKIYKKGITKENIQNALVEFEKTLYTPNARFDRYLRNEIDLSDEEKQGYALFKNLGCISCHQGVNVGGNVFQKFGVFYNYLAEQGDIKEADYGRHNTTQRQLDKFVFKVPSLRNVAITSPYLHNGSAETLDDAIRIMGNTQLGRVLDDNNIALIKSFLNTLTGEYKNSPLAPAL